MICVTNNTSPQEATTGKLSAAYWVYVSVEEEEQIAAAVEALEAPLRRAVEESFPGQAGCAAVQKVQSTPPPAGSGYRGWVAVVTVLIDLTAWRRDLGLVDGRYASMTVRDLLADADLSEAGAQLGDVVTQLLVHAPA